MSVRDLIPWGRNNNQTLAAYRNDQSNPVLSLHREVNRLFDDVFRGFDTRFPAFEGLSSFNASWPSVEVSETDKDLRITAEVPGLDEKDIEVLLNDGVLTIRGEKLSESEDKEKQFSERYYGRFERRIPVGHEIEEDNISASFKNGVLTVELPKTAKALSQVKRIVIAS
jgi:HSP20 family protein